MHRWFCAGFSLPILGLVCAACLPKPARAEVAVATQAAIVAAVAHDRTLFGARTPGVLVGVWDGAGGSYVHGFGAADLATHRPFTAADHVRIGSNTKTFVISVLLQLVDEGRIGLDDPISRFDLGVAIPDAAHITVRELCQMRSGLFEAYDTPEFDRMHVTPETVFEPRQVIGWAVRQKPYFPPGTGYRYSNTNYLILGLIIESITGHPIGEEIRTRLLAPLRLSQTSWPTTQAMPAPWAHGYGKTKTGGWEDVSNTIPISLMGAAGEMISTLPDMRRWVEMMVQGKTSAAATQRARMDCVPIGKGNMSFGLGLGCSAGWYGYTGGLPGYNTAAYYFPAANITLVVFVTLQEDKPQPGVANTMVRDIARILTPGNVPFELEETGGNGRVPE